MHSKRVLSLANVTLGTMHAESLAIHLIGQGLAQPKDLERKHRIKHVDRLLSNCKLYVWDLFDDWVPYLVGDKKEKEDLGFDYIIRFLENIHVTDEKGEMKQGFEWVPGNGRLRTLNNAKVTGKRRMFP